MATPHEQRRRELEALRQLIAELKPHAESATVPNSTVADIFDRHSTSLPPASKLRESLEHLAARLREGADDVVVGSRLRQIVVQLQQTVDRIGSFVDARDARLRQRE